VQDVTLAEKTGLFISFEGGEGSPAPESEEA
jgi:hypothetical protein